MEGLDVFIYTYGELFLVLTLNDFFVTTSVLQEDAWYLYGYQDFCQAGLFACLDVQLCWASNNPAMFFLSFPLHPVLFGA